MVIFLKGMLPTLDQFIDEMASGIKEEHIIIDIRNINELSKFETKINSSTIVITFNNVGLSIYADSSTTTYWEACNVTLFNVLVDHPYYYTKEIEKHSFDKLYYVCIDRNHVRFLRSIYPDRAANFLFLPHGGTNLCLLSPEKKDIEILYVGSCNSCINPKELADDELTLYIFEFYEKYYKSKKAESFTSTDSLLKASGLPQDKEMITSLEGIAITYEKYLTSVRRIGLITALASEGFTITVYGSGIWDELKQSGQYPTLDYRGHIAPEECVRLIAKSKILINDSPYFMQGAHERIFNGMLNKTVIFTNESEYLQERFSDGKDILFWNGHNIDDAVSKIAEALSDADYLNSIAESAFAKVTHDTWADRAMTLIDYANKNATLMND